MCLNTFVVVVVIVVMLRGALCSATTFTTTATYGNYGIVSCVWSSVFLFSHSTRLASRQDIHKNCIFIIILYCTYCVYFLLIVEGIG